MKSDTPDNFLKVTNLLKKLGDLAEALNEISKKMRLAAEKQRITFEHLGTTDRERRKILEELHQSLRCIEQTPVRDMELFTAKKLSQDLIDANPDPQLPLRAMSFHEYLEFTCLDEFKKFRNLPAITPEEIHLLDWDELYDRFGSGT